MSHLQENEHEQTPVDIAFKSGLLPDGYERFFSDGYELEDETDSTEEATYVYDLVAQLTDSQEEEDAVKSMPQKELEKILEELDKHEFDAPVLCRTIRKAIINALRKFPHAEVIQLFPKRKPQPEPAPQPERKPIDLTKRLPKISQLSDIQQMQKFIICFQNLNRNLHQRGS